MTVRKKGLSHFETFSFTVCSYPYQGKCRIELSYSELKHWGCGGEAVFCRKSHKITSITY